jgi:uncharacterized delta-60 repeat protein
MLSICNLRKGTARLLICGVTAAVFAVSSLAKPGDVDKSFATGSGSALLDVYGEDVLSGLAIQSNGKIVVAGSCQAPTTGFVCLARLDVGGIADSSFGIGGKVVVGVAPTLLAFGGTVARQVSIALDTSDRIIVASLCGSQFCIRRFLVDGAVDTSFGNGGLAGPLPTSAVVDTTSEMKVALLSDQRILVVTTCEFVCFVRLTQNGQPDNSFGIDGFLQTSAQFFSLALSISASNMVYVTGNCQETIGMTQVRSHCTGRFTADGDADRSFGLNGLSRIEFVSDSAAVSNTLSDDGSLFVAGRCVTPNSPAPCVVKLGPDGVMAQGFGSDGIARINFMFIESVAIDQSKNLVVGGYCSAYVGVERCVGRFKPDGVVDSRFGDGGLIRLTHGPFLERVDRLAIDERGKIIAAGTCVFRIQGNWRDFCIARIHSDQNFFDLDNDNESAPSSDAILYLRHLLGFRETSLTSGALGTYADRTSATDIATYLSTPNPSYPNCSASIVGAPGGPQAMLDGIVLLRTMMGLTGDAVTNGIAFPAGTTRTSWADIKAHLNGNCGMALN